MTVSIDPEELGRDIGAIIRKEIARLEARIAALEARPPPMEDRGVFREGTIYPKNSHVTDRGSCWIALSQTAERPGKSRDWRLCDKVDRGRGRAQVDR